MVRRATDAVLCSRGLREAVTASRTVPHTIAIQVRRHGKRALEIRAQEREAVVLEVLATLILTAVVARAPRRAEVTHFPAQLRVGTDAPAVAALGVLADGVSAFRGEQRLADGGHIQRVFAVNAVTVAVEFLLGEVGVIPSERELAKARLGDVVRHGQVVALDTLATDVRGGVEQRLDVAIGATGVQRAERTCTTGIQALLDDAAGADRGDRVLDLDFPPVKSDVEALDEARAVNEAQRLGDRLFRRQVRIATHGDADLGVVLLVATGRNAFRTAACLCGRDLVGEIDLVAGVAKGRERI